VTVTARSELFDGFCNTKHLTSGRPGHGDAPQGAERVRLEQLQHVSHLCTQDREAPGQGWGHSCWGSRQQDLFLAHIKWHLLKP